MATTEQLQSQWRAATARYRQRHLERCRETARKNAKLWRQRHPAKARQQTAKWAAANRDKVNAGIEKWYAAHPGKRTIYHRRYVERHRLRVNTVERQRYHGDHSFRLGKALRNRMRGAVRGQRGEKRTALETLLGCSIEFLMGHLQARFKPGMTWGNYGPVWEIDHKIPCAAFDLTLESQQRACFNFQNLQPLFKTENRRKWRHIERQNCVL